VTPTAGFGANPLFCGLMLIHQQVRVNVVKQFTRDIAHTGLRREFDSELLNSVA
jgi:hypothetical protein